MNRNIYLFLKWLKKLLFIGGFLLVLAGALILDSEPKIINNIENTMGVIVLSAKLYIGGAVCVFVSLFFRPR
ncbi:MAG: hypothetical protein HQL70_04370 [Magnetococcales bacterium]|nr:hypothetical protein [Magnetococcales bacterium]